MRLWRIFARYTRQTGIRSAKSPFQIRDIRVAKIKTPPTHGSAAIKFATLAVIGTLRPTDRRRAFIVLAKNIPVSPKMLFEWS